MKYKILFIATIFCTAGCQSTMTAINTPVPDQYLEVVQDDPAVNVEETLAASKADYFCQETWTVGENASDNRRVCYIKSPDQNQIKKLGTKVTDVSTSFIKDTGRNALVTGRILLSAALSCIGLSLPEKES